MRPFFGKSLLWMHLFRGKVFCEQQQEQDFPLPELSAAPQIKRGADGNDRFSFLPFLVFFLVREKRGQFLAWRGEARPPFMAPRALFFFYKRVGGRDEVCGPPPPLLLYSSKVFSRFPSSSNEILFFLRRRIGWRGEMQFLCCNCQPLRLDD